MDFTDALKAGGASATLIAIVGIVIKLIQSTCGHRIRSECCGKTASIGVKVETMNSPKRNESTSESTIVVRSARTSFETKVDHNPAPVISKPASEDLPVEIQARV